MQRRFYGVGVLGVASVVVACIAAACGSSGGHTASGLDGGGTADGAPHDGARDGTRFDGGVEAGDAAAGDADASVTDALATDADGEAGSEAGGNAVGHVIVVVQEKHTFDAYFGRWCTAPAGSNPTCTSGPSCCEAAPTHDPSGALPIPLDDTENAAFAPSSTKTCELAEIDNGKMDGFVTDAGCADPRNWAIAPDSLVQPYHDLAIQNAIADRYFQPIAGASSSNDLYFAVAKEVFIDDAYEPNAAGSQCSSNTNTTLYTGQTTIADLLESAGKTITWYAQGFAAMQAADGGCPAAPSACAHALPSYPCVFDPADIPLLYYAQFAGDGGVVKDYSELARAFDGGTLPDVSFVKALGYHSEHPGSGTSIVAGVSFVTDLVQALGASGYKDTTLLLLTWDEGGGFFDHVPPPAKSAVDDMPYGTRVPLLAIGHYARQGAVSHVQMEHASIVKFLEWNFLGGTTGQLQARDAVVSNIGSLLDPATTATPVPVQ